MKSFKEFIDKEEILNEAAIPHEKDVLDEIVLTAENLGDYYRKKDYKGAVKEAIKQYRKDAISNIDYALKNIEKKAIQELKKTWEY